MQSKLKRMLAFLICFTMIFSTWSVTYAQSGTDMQNNVNTSEEDMAYLMEENGETYSETFNVEPAVTTGIWWDQLADKSLLDLKIYDSTGDFIQPSVNKNGDEYKYTLATESGNLIIALKCDKKDTGKTIKEIKCTTPSYGEYVFPYAFVKDGVTLLSGEITLNAPCRVNDDSIECVPGSDADVLGNDYVTSKSQIVICDENGNPIEKQIAEDGTEFYSPVNGLNLINGKNVITVKDDSETGEYTFHYYVQEPGGKGKAYYKDDEKTPAAVNISLTNVAGAAVDDNVSFFGGNEASVNILDNDRIEGDVYAVKFYNTESTFWYCHEYEMDSEGNFSEYPIDGHYDAATGKLTVKGRAGFVGQSYFYYRVYFNDTDFVEAKVNVQVFSPMGDYVTVPPGQKTVIDVLENDRRFLPEGELTIIICNEDGDSYVPESDFSVFLEDNVVSVLCDEVGSVHEFWYKVKCNGEESLPALVTVNVKYMAMDDQADAAIGDDVTFNLLENDIIPDLSEVQGAVSRKIVITDGDRYSPVVLEPEDDGFVYPDKKTETDEITGIDNTSWSIRAKINDDNSVTATIYRQKKSGFNYEVQYLDDGGNVIESYTAKATVYPVLDYSSDTVKIKGEFDPEKEKEYAGDPDSENRWQVVKGDYYGDDYSVSNEDKSVIIEKNAAATDKENIFDIILDAKVQVSWEEFLANGTCRLQNGNSDSSSNRILLYPSREQAEKIRDIEKTAGNDTRDICEVTVNFFHDDWKKGSNTVASLTRYVLPEGGGNYYLYYRDLTPDQGLHGEAGQSRKIMDGNVYYVDITNLYNEYSFLSKTVIPEKVEDPMGSYISFIDFIYNKDDAAEYDSGKITWNVGNLYKGMDEDVIEAEVNGKKSYYHQYNLVYSALLDTDKDGFVSMNPYVTNGDTVFEYRDEKGSDNMEFKIPEVQGKKGGSLSIEKTVTGNAGDKNKYFTFKVELDSEGKYDYTGSTSGVIENGGTIKLKHGDKVTIKDLPVGTEYRITESDNSGYKVTMKGETGTIKEKETAEAEFINYKNSGGHNPGVPDIFTSDHYAYIIGYPVDFETGLKTADKSRWPVKPEGNITRAEVATIFFRMLKDDVRSEYWRTDNEFSDVKAEAWYNNAISTLANMGILNGKGDGKFYPDSPITRAELAAISSRFDKKTSTVKTEFTDIDGHWAYDEIGNAYEHGWVNGYPDGTFKPDNYITRAETMTLVNRVLGRIPESAESLDDNMLKWPDNLDTDKWYYTAVQEATNSHDYKMVDELHEVWKGMRPVRDWEAFEKIWSDQHSAENPGDVVK